MSLDPITFPTRAPSRLAKAINAIARFETHHPMAAMAIAWAVLGVVLVISVAVQP